MLTLSLVLSLLATVQPAKESWVTKYFYDEEASSFTITDFQFPSVKRGIASGFTTKKDKTKPLVLVTSDAGEHWTSIPVKEIPVSLFFLDDALGWMVSEKSLWKTEESGRSWTKVPNAPKDITRLWFLDRDHGFALALEKKVFETKDGAKTWTPLEAAALPNLSANTLDYTVISFAEGRFGVIAGSSDPPRHAEIPNWIDPKKARDRPQWPTTIALLQTSNAGKTWSASTASIFGQMTRISAAPGGKSLGLVEFKDNFAYPSEVFLADGMNGGKSERVYRQSNRFITDVLLSPDGTAYLAGVEAVGTVRNSPIPGKLRMLRSRDLKTWTELPADFRAEAHRAILASPDAENVWVATDTGMILKLVRQP